MASNSFGTLFRITTWGESHGKAIGVVIDGCPAGLPLDDHIINQELTLRAPKGDNPYTTPRKEPDDGEILSGIFEGKTTGAPISIIIHNKNADSSKYEPVKNILRPGHANFTYINKYGCFDYRGGGRASARETACRVAAGAVAKQCLSHFNIEVMAYIDSIANIRIQQPVTVNNESRSNRNASPIFCPDKIQAAHMMKAIQQAKDAGDSVGGIVAFTTQGLPVGLGDPVYEKLEANLAKAMLSIPASKGFSIGAGFESSTLQGSEHNDEFSADNKGNITLTSNRAGGVLGGISTGHSLEGQVHFKPTSSIVKKQNSATIDGTPSDFTLPTGSRHDPCVAIRAVPVVEAMLAITLADAILMNRSSQL